MRLVTRSLDRGFPESATIVVAAPKDGDASGTRPTPGRRADRHLRPDARLHRILTRRTA
jgi:hypothetical protein